jgi:hypothetical protein
VQRHRWKQYRWPVLLAVALLAAAFGAVAKAHGDGSSNPRIGPVLTRFDVTQTSRNATTCLGEDGTAYEVLRQVFTGTSVAEVPPGDPNLTGTLTVRSTLFRNTVTGDGVFKGTAVVVSDTAHRPTFVGTFAGATNGARGAGGLLVGNVRGPSDVTDGKLIGNMDITFADPEVTAVTGTVGGLGNPEHPAVIARGFCGGEDEDRGDSEH